VLRHEDPDRERMLPQRELESLTPEEVFILKYRLEYDGNPPKALKTAFRVLLAEVETLGAEEESGE